MKLKIDKVVYGGYGLAKENNTVYFVPYTLPDEEVEIEVVEDKKDYKLGRLVDVLKPSEYRVKPACEYFTACGGCDFQHMTYENQLLLKKEILKDQLLRIGKIETEIEKIIPSKEPFRYRNRTQLKFDGKNLGFYKKDSNDLVNVDYCLLLKEDIEKLLNPLKKFHIKYAIMPSNIHIFSNTKEEKLVRFEFLDESQFSNIIYDMNIFREEIDEKIKGIGFYAKHKRYSLLGEDVVFENIGDYKFRVSMDSFFQVNVYQIENLIDEVVSEVEDKGFKKLVDFYCGVGTLTIPASKYVKEALGIESNEEAVKDAKANIKHNKLKNVKFLKAQTEKGLKYAKDFLPEVVIFDPPRSGLNRKIINEISQIQTVRKIIYVSCDPSTLSRDLRQFIENGFKLKKVKLIDMFPQTYHIESIGILER
jgi:23S rRNA (uracil1939-C5)-methyltransferase